MPTSWRSWSMPRAASTRTSTRILAGSATAARQALLVLNKIDRLRARRSCWRWRAELTERLAFDAMFMISALTATASRTSRRIWPRRCRRAPGTTRKTRSPTCRCGMLAAEITREQIFHRLHDELPYAITVETRRGRSCATAACASSRRSSSSAKASARSCSARAARPSSRSRWRRARRSPASLERTGASVPVRQGARELGRRSRALSRDGTRVPQGIGRDEHRPRSRSDRPGWNAGGARRLRPGDAAVRRCMSPVTSGPQQAVGVLQGQRLAIGAWIKAVGAAHGPRFTSWRLAVTRSLTCGAASNAGVVCEARATPCVIEQAPTTVPPPLQGARAEGHPRRCRGRACSKPIDI